MSNEEELLLKRNSFLEKELIAKNRELEIETSLETVRAKAMAMQGSADLKEVVKTLFEELRHLDVNLQACLIATFDPVTSDQRSWMIHRKTNEPYSLLIHYNEQPFYREMLKAWKERNINWSYMLEGEAKTKWEKFLFNDTGFRLLPSEVKEEMYKPKKVFFAASYYQYGAIQASSPESLSSSSIDILQRFSKVFDTCYTRFLDLKKAESQAREAQIQLALERVRARTMAMQKSDELSETVFVLFEQFKELGEHPDQATIGTINEDEKVIEYWVTMYGLPINKVFKFSIDEPNVTGKIYKAWKEHKKSLVIDLSGKALSEFMEYRSGKGGAAINPDEKRRIINVAFFSKGLLNVQSNKERSKESIRLLERFASVFEQTYTRFLDLQKAEAQVRESQIQLALERVRAKTMAMQKPSEFVDVINIIGEQFIHLGFDFDWVNFSANGLDVSKAIDIWNFVVVPGLYQGATRLVIPFFEHPVFKKAEESVNEYQTSGNSFTVVLLDKKDKDSFLDHLFTNTIYKDLPDEAKTSQYNREVYQTSNVVLKDTWLSIGKYDAKPLTDEQVAILKRLANAFGQAYTRFLDLQKAEAQAREAEIQLALERVRARSLAMHHTSELQDVVNIVAEQLHRINIDINGGVIITINDEVARDIPLWASAGAVDYVQKIVVPLLNAPVFTCLRDAIKKRNNFRVEEYTHEEKIVFFKHLFKYAPWNTASEESKAELLSREGGYTRSVVVLNFTSIGIINDNGKKFSAEDNEILKRFGNVFEQSYTRFLDLQKAEAQAREAEIELGLERVRSRAMAMQTSEELNALIGSVFTELTKLDLVLTRCVILIYEGNEKGVRWWMANSETPSTPMNFFVKYADLPFFNEYLKGWYNREFKWQYCLEGENKIKTDAFLFTETELSLLPDFVIEGMKAPDRIYLNASFNNFGNLTLATLEPLSEEHFNILLRFAKVFDLTYTRFNDLKQAEARAREAQIELGLERVRARAMAMQKSDELAEAAQLLYDEFGKLGIKTFTCGYMFIDEPNNTQTAWVVLPDGTLLPNFIVFPLTGEHNLDDRYKSWKQKEALHVCDIQGEENKKHHEFLSRHVPASVTEDIFAHIPDRIIFYTANFSNGYLLILSTELFSPREEQTIIRFAKVFEQTYTRFLDLQKAEAQAREAQIEAALEKVRSRSLAMHKSDELKDVVAVVLEKLQEVGITMFKRSAIILEIEKGSKDFIQWVASPRQSSSLRLRTPYFDNIILSDFWKAKDRGISFYTKSYSFEEKNHFFKYFFNANTDTIPQEETKWILDCKHYNVSVAIEKNSATLIAIHSREVLSKEENEIVKRFARVFEQAYTRFLDLEKAEAQAKESQIQLALERVRARTMAMQKSDELTDVAAILFKQVNELGIKPWTAGFNVWSDDNNFYTDYITSPQGGFIEPYTIDATRFPAFSEISDARKRGEEFYVSYLEGEMLKQTYLELAKFGDKQQYEKMLEGGFQFPTRQYNHFVFGQKASLIFITYEPVPEAHDIFKRFGKTFEQTYIRFLDLQKAEAQARESQIQLALERVRARTMAMHKSDELREVVAVIYEQLQQLGFVQEGSCNINIMDEITGNVDWWMTGFGNQKYPHRFHVEYIDHPTLKTQLADWKSGKKYTTIEVAGESKKEFDKLMLSQPDFEKMSEETKTMIASLDKVIFSLAFMKYGALSWAPNKLTYEQANIFQRFATVFEQTYTRFLDLEKAEAQARETQIEAALERVRAKAMAMHNSNDVSVAASMVFTELRKLGIDPIRCGVGLLNKESRKAQLYSATSSSHGDSLALVGWVMLAGHPVLENIYNSWLNNQDYYPELTSPQLKSYYKNLLAGLSLPAVPLGETGETQYGHFFSFSVGCLYIWSDRHYTDAEIKILKRFAGIIDLTFRRYLDLQKAEIQAKEAQIQAALERIRGKAMAMHTTQDLSDTIGSFYHELQSFSLTPIRCGVGLLEKEERLGELYTWYTTEKGQSLELVGRLKMEGHPVLNKIYEGWLSQTEYHPVLRGNEIKEYYKILKPQMNFPDFGYDEVQFGYFFFFPEGGVYAWMEKEMQENELQIYRRFTSVLSLTYKRYRDLEKAEANAKEAVKQSALDRIRADIASMRTTQDLERITPLIWNELTILGVPFIRCGVFIMDETQQLIHSFLSTPEGKAIASFELPYDSAGELSDVLAYWRKNEIFKDHWDETKFTHWTKGLVEHGAITSEEKYSTAHAPVNLHLHFLPFLQGMLYVGSEVPLTTEEIRLAQTLADAFSTAYARYEDFNKLEAAKAQIEKTLTELRQAQAQLIQSEKMASLGELTAGIAHEIQNPLNFVNNFSEVNKEMLEELKAERLKPNTERDESLQDELINDVIENSEKINHHGKRADAIVKGMLQHSRVSSGQKEPTDINALADEYLRLSYHGLRAKDKNFNAIIETDFDKSIGKINVIPQEIGRVLLNLFNNAFYAVNEQKSLNPVSYKPTVSVKTENCDDKIYITVRDNGNGIPQKIIDKVFQPFFTTKPTGQGTGLGLSLSYDIIKAHGGEIKVESKEGEGSEFIIQLSDL